MLHVDIYRGLDGLTAVAGDWLRLQANLKQRRFFHRTGWWKSYLGTLDQDPESVSFFVVRRAGEAVAIFPLKRRIQKNCGLALRQWDLPRHLHMPVNGVLCDRNVDLAEVIDALTRTLHDESGGWDALSFSGVLAESALAGYAGGDRDLLAVTRLKTCDYLSCASSYEEVASKFSRNFRSNLNKARNKLAREKTVEFRSATDRSDLARGFAEFLDIEASGWKGAKGTGTAIKLHPELVRFYQSLIDEFCASREVMINGLIVDGKPIASQFCVKDDDTLYVLKLAYDEEWSRVAPGNMLLERVIEKGIRDKDFQYLNLVGDPPWFKDWRPESQDVYNIRLFNRTPAGLAYYGATKAKQWLKPYYCKYIKREHAPAKQHCKQDEKGSGKIFSSNH